MGRRGPRGLALRRRAALPHRARHLQQRELLALRRNGQPAHPHRRGERARDADRRREQQRGAHARAIAGDNVRRVFGEERFEDRRGGEGPLGEGE